MNIKGKKIDFSKQELYIGIDVHKKSWTVTIRIPSTVLKTYSMRPSSKELNKHMEKYYPHGNYHSVYEAGFSGFWLHRELTELGFDNIIVSPSDIPTSSKERLTKTDKVDSRKLARELSNDTLKGIYIPNIMEENLRGLSRQRYQQARKLARVKNQIKSYLNFCGCELPENSELQHWSKRFISHLQNIKFENEIGKEKLEFYLDELEIIKKRKLQLLNSLKKHLKEKSKYNLVEFLLTVPGIGFITATTFLTEIIDIYRFPNSDKLASYIGLVPAIESSGETEKVLGLSFQYNKYLRQLLVEASWIAVRNDPALTLVFNKYLVRMSKQKAIIRIARKLLNRMFYVLKNKHNYVHSVVA